MHATTLAPFKGRFTDGAEGLQRALSRHTQPWVRRLEAVGRECAWAPEGGPRRK